MLNRRVKSKFLLGTVTAGLTSSFSASANIGGKIANSNSSISQFLNWGKSILFSKCFFILAGLIFLGVYFYKKGQGDSDGSSGSVMKNKVMTDVKEIKADGFVPKINMGLLKNNELNINKEKSDDNQELLALRKKFQRLESYEGIASEKKHFEIYDLLYNPKKTEEEGGNKYKKIIASIRRLIKENFSCWANMLYSIFTDMEKEKEDEAREALISGLVSLMKDLQGKGFLRVNGEFDWNDKQISISKKLESISEVKAYGLQKLAEWTWKNFFIDIGIGERKDNSEPVKEFISTLEDKYRKISGWLSTNFGGGAFDSYGEVRKINKEKVIREHKDEERLKREESSKYKKRFINLKRIMRGDPIDEETLKSFNLEDRDLAKRSLSLEDRGISSII